LDDAVKQAIHDYESANIDVVTDGEQRRFSFFLGELFAGIEYRPLYHLASTAAATTYLGSLGMPQTVKHPIIVAPLTLTPHVAHELAQARQLTTRPVKVTLPSPYLLMIDGWNQTLSKAAYATPADAGHAVARLLNQAIRTLRDQGAAFIQLDDPALTDVIDPAYYRLVELINGYRPGPAKEELGLAQALLNEAVQGISGVRLGLHVCRGNWPGPENALPRGGYGPIVDTLLGIHVDQLVLELATPRAGGLEAFTGIRGDKEVGVGCVDVKSARVEAPAEIVQRVEAAMRYFDRIWLNPDCGFASGRDWPVATREVALAKLQSMVQAAVLLKRKYA
jgi:5-methyltetrahydropteroyltriglutamate--homocysteine methyltransferase